MCSIPTRRITLPGKGKDPAPSSGYDEATDTDVEGGWTLKYQYTRFGTPPVGEYPYSTEAALLAAAEGALSNIWNTNFSAILPGGREVDEQELRRMVGVPPR